MKRSEFGSSAREAMWVAAVVRPGNARMRFGNGERAAAIDGRRHVEPETLQRSSAQTAATAMRKCPIEKALNVFVGFEPAATGNHFNGSDLGCPVKRGQSVDRGASLNKKQSFMGDLKKTIRKSIVTYSNSRHSPSVPQGWRKQLKGEDEWLSTSLKQKLPLL